MMMVVITGRENIGKVKHWHLLTGSLSSQFITSLQNSRVEPNYQKRVLKILQTLAIEEVTVYLGASVAIK